MEHRNPRRLQGKRAKLLGLPLAAALGLFAFAGPALSGKANNVLVVGSPIDLTEPDAAAGTLGTDMPFLYTMHDRLIGFDPKDMSLRPMLATGWEWSNDNRTLTLKLREGVKFHDGTEFNAEAVKTSLEYFQNLDINRDIDDVTSIEVIDPLTIALTTEKPNSSLLGNLAERAGMIISPKSIASHEPGKIGFDTAGTGPYRIKEREPGSRIFFERFPDYWDADAAKLDGVEYRIIKNSTSMVTALMTGQLDYVSPLDPLNIPALEKNPNLRVAVEGTLAFGILNTNTGLKPTNDPRVRQALLMAINRPGLAAAVYGQNVKTGAALQPAPEGYWPHTDALSDALPYDPAKAKALLAEAGYPNGVEVSLCINANYGMPAPALKISDILREQFRAIGVTLNVTQAASNSVCSDMFSVQKAVNLFLASWSGRVDPIITYALMMGSKTFYNAAGTKYENADELIGQLQQTFDKGEQKPIFDKLNQIWVNQLPMLPLYYFSNVVAYNSDLTGEQPNLLGRPYVRTLHYK